jgi:L-iditol 2-dehydrogenase
MSTEVSARNEAEVKALVYTGPNGLELREVRDPSPANDEAVVRVEAVGICGSDMHAYHGYDERRPPPLILGHEAAGRVATGARAGRRVAVNPLITCESCEFCLSGRQHLCRNRHILSMPPRPGAFAELLAVPERNLIEIPDDLPSEHAALAEPIAVSYHAVNQGVRLLGRPLMPCRCVVLGGGAIGLAAALVLAMQGAGEILVAETNEARRATAARAGAFRCYAPGGPEEPADSTFDLIIDAVGATATRASACRMAKAGGILVHIGLLPGAEGFDVRKITLQELVVSGSYCYTPLEFREVVGALAVRRFGPLDWLEKRSLADGAAVFADLDNGRIAAPKIILRP